MLAPSSLFLAFALLSPAPAAPAGDEAPAEEAPPPAPSNDTQPDAAAPPEQPTEQPKPAVDAGSPPVDAAPAGEQLTLAEATELALKQRPRLKSINHDIVAQKTTIDQAKAAFYPQIDGSVQYVRATENGNTVSFHSVRGLARVGSSRRPGVRVFDSFNNYLVGVAVQQQIYDFGRTKGAIAQRKAEVMAAEHVRVQAEQQIAFEVARAYYDVLAARQTLDVAKDVRETTEQILELAKASQGAGLKPVSESSRAQANIATADVRVVRAEGALEAAMARFAGALGDAQGDYEPAPLDSAVPALPSDKDAIAAALANRPELAILDANRKRLDASMKAAKSQQLPRFDAMAGVFSRGQLMPRPANTGSFQDLNVNLGVVMSIPIFQGFRVRKQKEEIEARKASVADTQDEVSQAVIVEVRQALAAARAADRAALAAQSGVESAEVALTTLSARYSEGLARLVELTDAQSTYVAARLQRVDAEFDRLIARAALELAMGQN